MYALFCRLYFAPKEGNETYNQQRDVIPKPEHFLLQVTLDDKPLLCQIDEDLEKDPFIIDNQKSIE